MGTPDKITAAGSDTVDANVAEGAYADVKDDSAEAKEVFDASSGGVEFRTVSWQRATVLFLKIQLGLSILSVPSSLAALGAVGGSLSLIGWAVLNTYTALQLANFRNRHNDCHSLADLCGVIWGRIGRELVSFQILFAQVLIVAAGIISSSTAFNALSDHGACTVVFAVVSGIIIAGLASVRTVATLGWLTWFGFSVFFTAIFIFTVAVSQQSRPVAAPPTGDFDLGWRAIAYPTFTVGMTASANLFLFNSGSSMYLPITSEMRRPSDVRKSVLTTGVLITIIYFTFSLVIYRYCGVWITSPAFGSAGPLFKKISYGVALPGMIIGVGICQHVAAKLVFVRVLRDTPHMQKNTLTHWATWIGINFALSTLGFIVAEAVPILNYLLALVGCLCFAPFSLIYPMLFWMHEFRETRTKGIKMKALFAFHSLVILVGLYMVVGGTYGAAISIRDGFRTGAISKVFDCADNSATVIPG